MLGLLVIFSFNAINAQTNLTLDEAVSLALENNLNLQKNKIDLAASEYSEKKLWSEIFPTISASGSVGFASPLFSGGGFSLNENSLRYSTGIGISLGLNAGIPYTIKSIRIAHEANILRDADARKALSIQITKKFYSLIAEKNNLDLLLNVLNLAQRQYERNRISFENGLINELTLIRSSLAVENARYALSAANISYMNNKADFAASIGIEPDTELALLGEIQIIKIDADAQALIALYLPGRPDIERAKKEIERLELAQKQVKMQSRAPSLNLSVDWSSSKFDPFTDSLSGTARVSIPIDPWIGGTARSQSISRAGDSIEKARLDYEMTLDSAKTYISSLTALLRNSWDSIVIARLSLETAELSYSLTETAFRNGTVESLVLEDARNDMANARARILQSELTYFNLMLDLCQAINMDFNELVQKYGVQNEN